MRLIKLFIFCSLACLCWQSPGTAQQTNKGFADPASCASCHQAIAESYARTAMARTFGVVVSAQQFPELKDGNFHHPASAQQFSITAQDDHPYLKRHQTGFDGSVSNIVTARMDYWFGSGKHARSYISRTQNNELIELPLTWYREGNGYWAMSPGAEKELTVTLALDPQDHEARLRLDQLLLARGATAQAAPHLRKAAESKDDRIREAAKRILSSQ